ncbi:MAG TPA: HXXEE domain-containing protein [Vicinamibacteria bacterium]|nr:HXXEE domain-containing protein [Vicinamibacteria bacterium]
MSAAAAGTAGRDHGLDHRARLAFAGLIAAQGAHSIEEYATGLYDVFAPARMVSALFGDDLARGFAVANAAVVLLGFWCYVARVRPAHASARAWAWAWSLLELANGTGHLLLALGRGGYFPGAATAPILLALAAYLAARLGRTGPALTSG